MYLKSTVHLIELDTDNKSYQEIKDEMIQDIAQLVLMIIDYQDGLVQLNRGGGDFIQSYQWGYKKEC